VRPSAWRYRDWVVQAQNRDLRYDEFARLQIAGDVLQPHDGAAITATGFLVAGPFDTAGQNQQSETMKAVVRGDELEDLIGTVGQTFLGPTVNCARCHDHKSDPIRQAEYYGIASALSGVRHGERELSEVDPDAIALRRELRSLTARLEAIEQPARAQIAARRPPSPMLGPVLLAAWDFGTSPDIVDPDEISAARGTSLCAEHGRLRAVIERQSALLAERSKAYVVTPREAGPMRVHVRGNPNQLGEVIKAGSVTAVVAPGSQFGLAADAPEARRRIRLADWISHPRNPLFARVIANRLWQAHFGVGLVQTPSDFGWNCGKPSHPELLDWLASELTVQAWSLKTMHRMIVTSAAYRQSSSVRAIAIKRDAGDRLLWRNAPRRLEAEMVRDAMLAVSGILETRL